jgi:FkbM family methyltransferase
MKNPVARLITLNDNAAALAPLLGGYANALSYLVKTRGKGAAVFQAVYKGIRFNFRRHDIPALKEVLLKNEYKALLSDLTEDHESPVIIDIGAHIGLVAIWIFSIKPKAKIHSIEASPGTYKILQSNVALQSFDWRAENKAAWGKNEFITFADDSQSTMSHRVNAEGGVKIPTVTFAELTQGKDIDLMKIDIEGAEESFLAAENVDLSRVKALIMELHPNYCNADKVMSVLQKNFKTVENVKAGTQSKPLLVCRK